MDEIKGPFDARDSSSDHGNRVRLPALAWHLERHYGSKIPQCSNCGSHHVHQDYVRASFHCGDCGYEVTSEAIMWVPADPNAREPWEEHKPEGMWLDRFRKEVRNAWSR